MTDTALETFENLAKSLSSPPDFEIDLGLDSDLSALELRLDDLEKGLDQPPATMDQAGDALKTTGTTVRKWATQLALELNIPNDYFLYWTETRSKVTGVTPIGWLFISDFAPNREKCPVSAWVKACKSKPVIGEIVAVILALEEAYKEQEKQATKPIQPEVLGEELSSSDFTAIVHRQTQALVTSQNELPSMCFSLLTPDELRAICEMEYQRGRQAGMAVAASQAAGFRQGIEETKQAVRLDMISKS